MFFLHDVEKLKTKKSRAVYTEIVPLLKVTLLIYIIFQIIFLVKPKALVKLPRKSTFLNKNFTAQNNLFCILPHE